jgi:hypothetical protein
VVNRIAPALGLCLAGFAMLTTGCGHLGGFPGSASTAGSSRFAGGRDNAPPDWPDDDASGHPSGKASIVRVGPETLPQLPGPFGPQPPTAKPPTPSVRTGPTTFPSGEGYPAARYAALSSDQCLAAANARKLPIVPATARDVDLPVRLTGPLGGVRFLMGGAKDPGGSSPHEILDCRLALALADFGELLAPHGVTEVRHMSLYRAGARIARSGHPSKHGQGLAIDVGHLVFRDGTKWSVLDDWHGAIGDSVCDDAPRTVNPASSGLRAAVCEAATRGIFHLFLTPNHNRDHQNHLHIDLEPGWTAVKVH